MRTLLSEYRLVSLVVMLWSSVAYSADWSAYDQLLEKYVTPASVPEQPSATVNYAGLKAGPELQLAVTALEQMDVNSLTSRREQMAYYLNAYNLFTLKLVAEHWPVSTIKQIGSLFRPVWRLPVGKLGGASVTLDDVEHGILRQMGDPRIHFALTCGSMGCPDLRQQAYRAEILDEQLDDQVKQFLANPQKGMRLQGNTVYLSEIFSWFTEDFAPVGGVEAFLASYRPLTANAEWRYDLDYDWSVNNTSAKVDAAE